MRKAFLVLALIPALTLTSLVRSMAAASDASAAPAEAPPPAGGQAAIPPGARLIEATVASVNGEVLFLTDLRRESCLYRCGAFPGEEPADLSLEAVRDRLIADTLVLQEQRKLGFGEIDNAAVAETAAAALELTRRCASPCAAKLSGDAIREFVARRMTVRDFLVKRVSVFVEAGDEEVREEMRLRGSRAGAAQGELSEEKVREEMIAEKVSRETRNWFQRAASKSRIILSPLEGK